MEISKMLSVIDEKMDILDLERFCKSLDQVEFDVTHTFADGIYLRTMYGLAGTFAIGKRHRFKMINIITKGRAIIYSGNGKAKEIVAPCTFTSDPFVKKMAFFLEDTEWINVHPTDETDVDLIEKKAIITEVEYEKQIGTQNKIKEVE